VDRLQRLLPVVGLLFALAMAGLYFSSLGDDDLPPPPPSAAASPRATPAKRAPVVRPTRTPSAPKSSRSSSAPTLNLDPDREVEPEPPARAAISGQVIDERGYPLASIEVKVMVNGRRHTTRSDGKGHFSIDVPGGQIKVHAERRDGALRTRSEVVEFDATDGGEWEAELVLARARKAGLGIRIRRHEDGILVRGVIPDSPAAEIGVVSGDVITAVDGESLAGKTTTEAIAQMTGDDGTRAELTVLREDGSEETLIFERRFLDQNSAP